MANKMLQSLKFPGLSDDYLIPLMQDFAPVYDSTATYAVGDYCTHDNKFYVCKTAISTAEAWTAGHWDEVSVADIATAIGADVDDLKEALSELEPGLSDDAKTALLNCFQHVAWIDEHGQDYYDALAEALNGSGVDTLSAVLNLGTHAVYPTDNLQTLKDYLTVYLYSDGETTEITEYTLTGDISSVGAHTLTIAYENLTTTVNVTVETNVTGILYDWDFTDSLTDKRQLLTATLHTGEGWEIPGKSEGTTPPVQSSAGITFNDAQQLVRLFSKDVDTATLLLNKTVQIDVASFVPGYSYDSSHPETRFFMLLWDQRRTDTFAAELGIVYSTPSKQGSNTKGWYLTYANASDPTNRYASYERLFLADSPTNISGHTVSFYIDSTGHWTFYIDNTLKATSTYTATNEQDLAGYGLQIGAGARPAYGGTFYNAVVTGVRIYDGNVMQ